MDSELLARMRDRLKRVGDWLAHRDGSVDMGRKGCLGCLGSVFVIYVSLVVVAVVLWVVAHQTTRDNWGAAWWSKLAAYVLGMPWSLVYELLPWGKSKAGWVAFSWFGVLINCAILGTLWTKLLKAPDKNVKP